MGRQRKEKEKDTKGASEGTYVGRKGRKRRDREIYGLDKARYEIQVEGHICLYLEMKKAGSFFFLRGTYDVRVRAQHAMLQCES